MNIFFVIIKIYVVLPPRWCFFLMTREKRNFTFFCCSEFNFSIVDRKKFFVALEERKTDIYCYAIIILFFMNRKKIFFYYAEVRVERINLNILEFAAIKSI
jgi:hypothetical protein